MHYSSGTEKINLMPLTSFIEFQNYALYLNVNDGNDNVILGDDYYCIYSKGITPSFHPASFYQVNDFIEEKYIRQWNRLS